MRPSRRASSAVPLFRAPSLLALLLLAACPGAESAPATPPARSVSIDLVDAFGLAQVETQLGAIALGDPRTQSLLTSGWHQFEADGSGGGYRWTRRRDAVVEVPVVSPTRIALEIDVTPVQQLLRRYPNSPEQTMEVLWNGSDLGTFAVPLGGGRIEVEVPAKLQHVGPNRLELLPSYWLTPRWHLVGRDERTLGLRVARIGLRRAGAGPPPAEAPAVVRDDAIVQRSGSVMTWYFALPRKARLLGEARLAAGSGAEAGRVSVSLLDADGEETRLASEAGGRVAPGGRLGLDSDLGRFAGGMVALSFAFESAAGSEDPSLRLEWRGLRIEGSEAPGATAASASEIPRDRYNILVVLMDSLRADHIEPYGAERADTPTMRRLANAGVTFVNAYSNSAWTRPAVASMFTSLYPSTHGIEKLDQKLDDDLPYLPEILQRNGYATVGVSSTVVISPPFGMARGFDRLHLYWQLRKEHAAAGGFSPESEARFVWDRYIEPVVADGRPFFVYLHEIDPHSPYDPPEPYRGMFGSGFRANFNSSFQTDGFVRTNPLWVEPMDVEYLRSRYMGEISFMDRYLGWLLDALEKRGLRERTLVVLVSDHGEEFWDHRSLGHGGTVYEELLRVPLILSLPGVLPAGRRPQVDVELLDLAPTLLDLTGLEPIPGMQGRSLLPWLNAPEEARPAHLTVGHSVGPGYYGVRLGEWKLVRENPPEGVPGQPQYTLFNLRDDPREIIDLWAQQPVVGHTLRQLLEDHLQRTGGAIGERVEGIERAKMDEGLMENLRALGYVE